MKAINYRGTELTRRDIFIFSVSQAAIKSFGSLKRISKIVLDYRRSLQEMVKKHRLSLIWVSAHRDMDGNFKADELARLSTIKQILPDKVRTDRPLLHANYYSETLLIAGQINMEPHRELLVEFLDKLGGSWTEKIHEICSTQKKGISLLPQKRTR